MRRTMAIDSAGSPSWKDVAIMIAQSTGNEASVERRFVPDGPFDLATQNTYFGGWVTSAHDPGEIVMAFPVEGWQGAVAVRLRQDPAGADRRERRRVG